MSGSTEATLSCSSAVEFSKLSIFENILRLLSKLAAGRAGEGATARRQGVYMDILDAASTEATLSCASAVEFSKKSSKGFIDDNLHKSLADAHPTPL
jgi:hypothetical protein